MLALRIKTIKAKIKQIQKYIRDQLEPLNDIQKFIESLQELIAFIATLPARIAAFLKDCLSNATKGISDAISVGKDIASQVQSNINPQLTLAQGEEIVTTESTAQSASKNFEKP